MTGMGLRNLQKGGSYSSTLLYSGVRKSASSPFSIFSKMAEASSTASGKGVLAGTPAVWNPKDCWKIAFGARCVILAGSCSTKNEVGSDYSLRFVWCWDPVETNRKIASSRFQHFLRWAKPAALEAGRASSLGLLPRGILQNCCVNRIRCQVRCTRWLPLNLI